MLTRGAAAEILCGYDNVAFLYVVYEIRININHAVFCQLLAAGYVQISCGDDNVCIDVIPVFKDFSFCCFHYSIPPAIFSGSAI